MVFSSKCTESRQLEKAVIVTAPSLTTISEATRRPALLFHVQHLTEGVLQEMHLSDLAGLAECSGAAAHRLVGSYTPGRPAIRSNHRTRAATLLTAASLWPKRRSGRNLLS